MKIKLFIISLLGCFLACPAWGQADNTAMKATAAGVFDQLDTEDKYIENIQSSDLYILPFGIRKTISNNEFSIAVSNAVSKGNYIEMTAFEKHFIRNVLRAGCQRLRMFHRFPD